MKGADAYGNCMVAVSDYMMNIGDPTVTFLEDTVYGCGVQLNSSELESYCSNNNIISLPIFTNLEFWQ